MVWYGKLRSQTHKELTILSKLGTKIIPQSSLACRSPNLFNYFCVNRVRNGARNTYLDQSSTNFLHFIDASMISDVEMVEYNRCRSMNIVFFEKQKNTRMTLPSIVAEDIELLPRVL